MNNWVHLCIDMQRMFAENTPWHVPWMARVSDEIVKLSERFPDRTIFTRFITPERASDMPGMWKSYYEKWEEMTRAVLPLQFLDIVPDLARLVPPARIFDKLTYSPWTSGGLHSTLQKRWRGQHWSLREARPTCASVRLQLEALSLVTK